MAVDATYATQDGLRSEHPPAGGPRIVINPTTFSNSKDALCVAFNEGFRLWMESTDFQPQSEPTDRQRKFFSDTAYADDEVQLRRTILARIATFDTSVKDPTDDQLAETGSFLDAILESDWCKSDWERNCVSRLSEAVKASVGAEPAEPRPAPVEPREPEPLQSRAALGGGETEDEKKGQADTPAAAPETATDNAAPDVPAEPQEPQESVGPGQTDGQAQPQDAKGAAQEPSGAQGAVRHGNGQAQPQDAPHGQEEPPYSNTAISLPAGTLRSGTPSMKTGGPSKSPARTVSPTPTPSDAGTSGPTATTTASSHASGSSDGTYTSPTHLPPSGK